MTNFIMNSDILSFIATNEDCRVAHQAFKVGATLAHNMAKVVGYKPYYSNVMRGCGLLILLEDGTIIEASRDKRFDDCTLPLGTIICREADEETYNADMHIRVSEDGKRFCVAANDIVADPAEVHISFEHKTCKVFLAGDMTEKEIEFGMGKTETVKTEVATKRIKYWALKNMPEYRYAKRVPNTYDATTKTIEIYC